MGIEILERDDVLGLLGVTAVDYCIRVHVEGLRIVCLDSGEGLVFGHVEPVGLGLRQVAV
jgi:hypothetical protein